VACWNTKVAISLKRVKIEEKIEEKLLWRPYRNSPTLFPTVSSSTFYGLLFPKIGGSQPPPKTAVTIISGLQIWTVHSQGPSVCRKGNMGVHGDYPFFE